MDKLGLVLRTVVFFLFPIPFLLNFAASPDADWAGTVAYMAVGVLALAAVAVVFVAMRRGGSR